MELFILVVIVGGIIGAFYHPATKDSPFISQFRKILKGWLTVETVELPEPDDDDMEVISKEYEPGNVPRVKAETGKEPPTKNIHAFPKMRKPVTRFEEFNAKLFIYSPSETRRWDKSIDNDFSTTIKGEQSWLKEEIKRRSRPQYPVLFDPFGWWAKASSALELDPHFDDPTISAYLQFPRDKRPVVVSQLHEDDEEESDTQFTLYRYGFVDYAFERKFLADYPADLIHGLLKAFSGTDSACESFSPARLRKDVLECPSSYEVGQISL